jgi:hypothetical protein
MLARWRPGITIRRRATISESFAVVDPDENPVLLDSTFELETSGHATAHDRRPPPRIRDAVVDQLVVSAEGRRFAKTEPSPMY